MCQSLYAKIIGQATVDKVDIGLACLIQVDGLTCRLTKAPLVLVWIFCLICLIQLPLSGHADPAEITEYAKQGGHHKQHQERCRQQAEYDTARQRIRIWACRLVSINSGVSPPPW